MTVGTELAPGPNAVDITPTKDAGIMKEIKVNSRIQYCWHVLCLLLGLINLHDMQGFLEGNLSA